MIDWDRFDTPVYTFPVSQDSFWPTAGRQLADRWPKLAETGRWLAERINNRLKIRSPLPDKETVEYRATK